MADENTVEEQAQEAAVAKGPSKASMMIVIIVGFLVMILTPLISFFVVKAVAPTKIEEAPTEIEQGAQVMLDVDSVRVNITGTKATRFAMLKAHLVLSEAQLLEVLEPMKAMLADKISTAVSRRTIDELEGPEAREKLKKDIMVEINAVIEGKMKGAVVDVYLSEFLIQ
ncbi:hypothetical protein BVX97_01575 [bacterium E08(2017)]|nr:hypothetical protein BVX97_01575 [bacterium E08(2017)]